MILAYIRYRPRVMAAINRCRVQDRPDEMRPYHFYDTEIGSKPVLHGVIHESVAEAKTGSGIACSLEWPTTVIETARALANNNFLRCIRNILYNS